MKEELIRNNLIKRRNPYQALKVTTEDLVNLPLIHSLISRIKDPKEEVSQLSKRMKALPS